MRKMLLLLFLLLSMTSYAQNDHVVMKSSGTLFFTPTEFSSDGNAVMHVMHNNGVSVYDNEIVLKKIVAVASQEFRYLSSKRRTRTVERVVRTAVECGENLTGTYVAYAASKGKEFSGLTYAEQQGVIMDYEKYLYNSDVEMREEENFTLFLSRNYNGMNFFNYTDYEYSYPKVGLLLDKNGGVYRFQAAYRYEYSAWSEYTADYDTISSEKNIFTCITHSTLGGGGSTFCISSTLFNDDEGLEYIRPVYTLVDAPVYEFVGDGNPEMPITSEGECFSKELAIRGLEIVGEDGAVLGLIDFDKEYSSIGNFSLMMGSVISVGYDIAIMELGENRFISFDTCADEMGTITIYKHFYKIKSGTSSIEPVNAPVCIKVLKKSELSVEVEYGNNSGIDVELSTIAGHKCDVKKLDFGRCTIDVNGSGTYILTLRDNGAIVGSRKILVR